LQRRSTINPTIFFKAGHCRDRSVRKELVMHQTLLRNATLGTAAIVSILAVGGCTATPAYTPSSALLARSTVLPSDTLGTPRLQLSLAAGDRVGMQMRDTYLARENGTLPREAQPVLVLQSGQ
jgi:hypothetical protein